MVLSLTSKQLQSKQESGEMIWSQNISSVAQQKNDQKRKLIQQKLHQSIKLHGASASNMHIGTIHIIKHYETNTEYKTNDSNN